METLLPKAMLWEREKVRRKLKRALHGKKKVRDLKAAEEELKRMKQVLEDSALRKLWRASNIPRIVYPEHLPIVSKKDEIVSAIKANQVVIISGETGSGKSTQIPKMCLEAGRGIEGMIGCTQPRRIAAITIAHRIAEELGEQMGGVVGYKIRFSDRTSPNAYVKIMTDGILLAETQGDHHFYQYDTIIIDEAHERSVNIDFLLGLLKRVLAFRSDLKVIVSSATLEIEKFSSFFDNAPVIEVSGKVFPVEVRYASEDSASSQVEDTTYVDMAVEAVEQIKRSDPTGDILVFMPTEQDIMETCQRLEGRLDQKQNVLPLFARLPASRQKKIYTVKGSKVVVATNVAETSLTIPGIKYVVDTGLARISRYVARTRTTSLPISPISQASAEQRKGRCGRVQKGVCIRLYSQEDFEGRPVYTVPEILRANLAEVILRMIYLRLGHIESFPFLDRPNPRSIKDGFELLVELGAVKRDRGRVRLTDMGRKMARLPLDPRISRMLLEAISKDCVEEVAVIGAVLSIQDPRERPLDKAHEADQSRLPFKDPDSDFLTLLKIWNAYREVGKRGEQGVSKRKFCRDHFLSYLRMREWDDVYNQLMGVLKEYGYRQGKSVSTSSDTSLYERIHKCILSGFLSNIGFKKEKNIYQAAKGKEVMIFPGSCLFNKSPEWIVAAEMVKTSRLFARTVARVEPEWIEEVGGDLCKRSYSNPRWSRAAGKVVASEQVSLFGLIISKGRPVPYGPMNPDEAHEIFVREALVEGNIRERFDFLRHNQELREELSILEHKFRKKGIVADEEKIKEFYHERLPGVYDLSGLRKRIREAGSDDFLKMKKEDLLIKEPQEGIEEEYPDSVRFGEHSFGLSYNFSPGKEEDGVTVSVPASLASELPLTALDWIAPGLLKEKIRELIRALPKEYRRRLIPIAHSSEVIARELRGKNQPLAVALSSIIEERFGLAVPPKIWSTLKIPDHLRLRISVVDPRGKELVATREAAALRKVVGGSAKSYEESEAWKQASQRWERRGIKKWDFGALPEKVMIDEMTVAYPALVSNEGSVDIRLCRSAKEALEKHLSGVSALCCLELAKDLKFVKRTLKLPEQIRGAALYFGGQEKVEQGMFEHLVRALFARNIRDEDSFYEHLATSGAKLYSFAKEILDVCANVLHHYHEVRQVIGTISKTSAQNKEILSICKEIELDLQELVPQNFLGIYDKSKLEELPRYLKAARIRAQRAGYDPTKDRRKKEQLQEPLNYLDELRKEAAGGVSQEKLEAIEAYRWMIEEFKISLFAQEMGTAYPVSLQRLRKKKEEIDRMI